MEGAPFVIPTAMVSPPRRPSVLTTAAIALAVLAVLNGLLAALGFWAQGSSGTSQLVRNAAAQLTSAVAVERLIIGALQMIAAVLILRLTKAGRVLGLVIAGVEALEGFRALIDGRGTAALAIGVNLFLIYALTTTGDVFARARRG